MKKISLLLNSTMILLLTQKWKNERPSEIGGGNKVKDGDDEQGGGRDGGRGDGGGISETDAETNSDIDIELECVDDDG